MSDRRDRMPPEYRDSDPEEFVDVFITDDGQIGTPTRGSIASNLEEGRKSFAFALMQFQLLNSAKAIMRRAGCPWRRSDALYFANDPDYDARADIAAMVEDATEFMSLARQDEQTSRAYETLLSLKWQTETIDRAATDAERDALRRMALVSVSLGFLSAHAGIEGVEPSLPEIMDQAKIARSQQDGGDKGRETLVKKADAWREPLRAFAIAWLQRRQIAETRHGLISEIVTAFRATHPEVRLSSSDGPNREVSRCVRQHLNADPGR